MIIRHDLELIFLHVPKCAGKELREIFLINSRPHNTEDFFNFVYSPILHRHVDLAHLPMDDLAHFPVHSKLKNYTIIAAVRNPYERLRSAINEYYRQYSKSDEAVTNRHGPTAAMRLHYLRQLPIRHGLRDPRFIHSLPITWFTHHGYRPMVDHVLRCESLASDMQQLASTLHLPAAMRECVRKKLRNQPETPPERWDPPLSEGEIQLANQLYALDFSTFDYPMVQRPTASTATQEPAPSEPTNELLDTLASLTPLTQHSHSIDLLERAASVEWHWGPTSRREDPGQLPPTRHQPHLHP